MPPSYNNPNQELPPWLQNQATTPAIPQQAVGPIPHKAPNRAYETSGYAQTPPTTQSLAINQPPASGGYSQEGKPKAVKHLTFVLGEPNPKYPNSNDTFFGKLTEEGKQELWNLANSIVQGQVQLDDVRLRVNVYSFLDTVKQSRNGYFKQTVAGGVFSLRKPK